MITHGHPNCERYPVRRFRRLLEEVELAEHERFGREVLAARLAQMDDKSFTKWMREHDNAGRAMRERLADPAMRNTAAQTTEQPGARAEPRVPLSERRHGR